jgi:hypothetical protein
VHVVHELRTGLQRLLRHRVEVADDHVGPEADLEQGVGAPVDADEHRPVLAYVRSQRREVAAVVVPAHDDQRVPASERRPQRRERERLEGEARLVADVFERVLREALELGADRGARRVHLLQDLRLGDQVALGEELAVAPHAVAVDLERDAVTDDVEEVGTVDVEQRDPGVHHADRATVRIAAADRGRRVHDCEHAGLHEPVGRDAVEIRVADHRDLTRLDALHQILRPAVDPGGADEHRDVARLSAGVQPAHRAALSAVSCAAARSSDA